MWYIGGVMPHRARRNRANQTGATPREITMRLHSYKLAGSAIPKELVGQVLNVRIAESTQDARDLCKDGDEARIVALFNQQNVLNQERVGKAVAESEDVAKLVSAGRVTDAMKAIQTEVDSYLSGARAAGVPSEAKVALTKLTGAKAKIAAMEPTQAERARKQLAALGIDL